MNKEKLYNKILGMLVTAGFGDALGAPAEAWSRSEIIDHFGGLITEFSDPGQNVYVSDNLIGEVTDDTSQMYEIALSIINHIDDYNVNYAAQALVDWSKKYPKYYPRNAGPTTRYIIEEFEKGKDPIELGKMGGTYDRGFSNGAAMRIAPAGAIFLDDLDSTIDLTIEITKSSHGTQHGYAGACAIACAINEALKDNSNTWSIIQAALYGARRGEEIGRKEARIAYGFATEEKILMAIDTVNKYETLENKIYHLERVVGNDGSIQTTAGWVLGIFLATDGDSYDSIIQAANGGGDTDTHACIVGMICGAYNGFNVLNKNQYEQWKKANPSLNMEFIADKLTKIALSKYQL
ncbi:ADP-ribosylglycohydrolase family protein [Aerococcus urinae]|uniref:ADP-ribosylglycohydrolase family protein n=1 Tax=Aerococcus urinae TaxID=1376 RepID=UPI002550DCF5|nr:ADP-ribosylglycohydrolase family protein [Aerococcus urinae]MDK6371115.1 ADP-ribosylglycohydrolase family protein [Aerococcus urinae]